MNTIHPFPGTATFLSILAVSAVLAAFIFLPADYTLCAAVVLAFVGTLCTAGE